MTRYLIAESSALPVNETYRFFAHKRKGLLGWKLVEGTCSDTPDGCEKKLRDIVAKEREAKKRKLIRTIIEI